MKNKLQKSLFFSFFFLLILFIITFFYKQEIYQSVAIYYLENISIKYFGEPIQYEKIVFNGNKIVVKEPFFFNLVNEKEGGYAMKAKDMHITPQFYLFQRKIHIDLSLKDPILSVTKLEEDLPIIPLKKIKSFYFLNLEGIFSFDKGVITLIDKKEKKEIVQNLFLKGEFKSFNEGQTFLSANLGKGALDLLVSWKNDQIKTNLKTSSVPLTRIFEILGFFHDKEKFLTVEKGVCSGEVSLTYLKNKVVDPQGFVSFKDVQFYSENFKAKGAIGEMDLICPPADADSINEVPLVNFTNFKNTYVKIKKEKNIEKTPFWFLNHLQGSVSCYKSDQVEFFFKGNLKKGAQTSKMIANGFCSHPFKKEYEALFQISYKEQEKQETLIKLELNTEEEDRESFALSLEKIEKTDVELLQGLAALYYPQVRNIEFQEGKLSAYVQFLTKDFQPQKLFVEGVDIQDCKFSIEPWKAHIILGKVKGAFSVDFTQSSILDYCESQLNISKALVDISLGEKKWTFSNIEALLFLKSGEVKKTMISGDFPGGKGSIKFDRLSSLDGASFYYRGGVKDLYSFFPKQLQQGLQKKIIDDSIIVTGEVKGADKGYKVEGDLILYDLDKKKDTALFECYLEDAVEKKEKEEKGDVSLYEQLFLSIGKMAGGNNWFFKQLGLNKLYIKDAKFFTKGIDLGKYLTPFIWEDDQLRVSGVADIQGVLERDTIIFNYRAKDIVVEGEDFSIYAKNLSSSGENDWPGLHQFDLKMGINFGYIPIEDALYIEKNTSLVFEKIKAKAYLEGKKIHVSQIETESYDINFLGDVYIDWSFPAKGEVNILVETHKIMGNVKNLKRFCSHFKDSPFLNLPIEGEVSSDSEGYLNFHCTKGGCSIETKLQGYLEDGIFFQENPYFKIEDLYVNFVYLYPENIFDLSLGEGTLHFLKSKNKETLKINKMFFSDLSKDSLIFDFSLVNRVNAEVARVLGETIQRKESKKLDVILDLENTHIVNQPISKVQMSLKDWGEVDQLEFNFSSEFHPMVDLFNYVFIPLEELEKSELFLKKIKPFIASYNSSPLEFSVQFLGGDESIFKYGISTKNLSVSSFSFDQVILEGAKQGSEWSIQKLQLDEFLLASKVAIEDDVFDVKFLEFSYLDDFLLKINGKVEKDKQIFCATIDKLKGRLDLFSEVEMFRLSSKKWLPKGEFLAKGSFLWDFSSIELNLDPFWKGIKGKLEVDSKELHFGDIQCNPLENFVCNFDLGKGFSFEKVKGEVFLDSLKKDYLLIDLGNLDYSFLGNYSIQNLSYDIPHHLLKETAKFLGRIIPDKVNSSNNFIIENLKDSESVKGDVSYFYSEKEEKGTIFLSEDEYQVSGVSCYLKDFSLNFDQQLISLSTQFLLHETYYYFLAKLGFDDDQLENPFEIALSERLLVDPFGVKSLSENPDPNPNPNPYLKILFDRKNKERMDLGVGIKKIEGEFSGITADVIRKTEEIEPEKEEILEGSVNFDLGRMRPLFASPFFSSIVTTWGLENGYQLKGEWRLPSDNWLDFTFNGKLLGNKFQLKGLLLEHLNAKVFYQPDLLTVKDLEIKDEMGALYCKDVTLQREKEDSWQLEVPKIEVLEFRPSELKKSLKKSKISRNLVIQEFAINNLSGRVSDSNTFVGDGYLKFKNRSKGFFKSSFFSIPNDLLSRLGLDLSLLTPVEGTILYQIQDGKIWLKKFKDVYSDAKASRFYLSQSSSDSYIDFNGNLHVLVRMKQYNLLFKIAEIFTVTVHGNIKKPEYSLTKQPLSEKKMNPDLKLEVVDNKVETDLSLEKGEQEVDVDLGLNKEDMDLSLEKGEQGVDIDLGLNKEDMDLQIEEQEPDIGLDLREGVEEDPNHILEAL